MQDGVSSVTSGLARTLVRLGHRVRVYAPEVRVGAASWNTVEDGVRVRRIRSVPVPLYSQYRWPVFPFGLIRGVRDPKDIDVIHLHSPGPIGSMGFLLARRFRRPLVGTFHTNIREMRASVPQKLLVPLFFRVAWWYNLGTYWRCDVTTAPSQAARAELERSARKPFRRPVEVVPNAIDVERFRPGEVVPDWRARCGLSDAPLATYLGRLTVDKGVHRFLDAVASAGRTTDLNAIVAGAGPEEAAVRSRIARDPSLHGRVRYVGPIAESEKAALLGQTDVFVLPSTSDTSSVALLEAMACGTTVVAPATGGASEVVEDGVTGVRVDAQAPQALADVMVRLVERTADREAIARQATAWVHAHASLESAARRFISLYQLLREERSRRGDGLPA
jgi:glycosyltransferase involved in cell wall biosynthesis